MIKHEHIVVGLDVGTTHICAAVGERLPSGHVSIIGIGESESRGIRKGEIVDREQAETSIRSAITQAEENAGVEIHHVTIALSGGHMRSFNNRGIIPVMGENHEISEGDVAAVIRNAQAINIPVQNECLHTLQQHFSVDGQNGILDPIGMTGTKLEADVHVIHGVRTRLQNTIRTVKAVGLEVDDAVFSGLATALGVLTPHDKEVGSIVIDCGGGTTEFVVYVRDSIKHSGIIAIGGDHLTNDAAVGLKIPLAVAERLKRERGTVLLNDIPRNQKVTIQNDECLVGRREVARATLCQILQLRAEEIFSLIKQEILRNGCSLDYIGAGVFLGGGSANLHGIEQLAQSVFGLPVHKARVRDVAGNAVVTQQTSYTTAVGLVKYGLHTQTPPSRVHGIAPLTAFGNRVASFFARARNIF